MKHDDLTNKGFELVNGEYVKRSSGCVPQSAVAQPPVQHEPMAEEKGKACDTGRVQVRVTSYRNRLLDPDNLCPKYFIDCLRYAEIIPNDREADIKLEVTQQKAKEERTEITIEPLEDNQP